MAKFILSEFIEDELAAMSEFIAFDNLDAADRFVEAAYETFQTLARMPGMGRVRKFPRTNLRELRSFRVKGFENFLVFYEPLSDGIYVLHVIHGARDLDWFWEDE